MKKSGKTRQPKAKRAPKTIQQPKAMDRRQVLKLARNAGIAVLALGGAGVFGTRAVMAKITEHDLTRIGQGIPTIVQVHDPNCSLCRSLQKESRKALKGFEEEELVFLVANLSTTEGQQFAQRYRVPHVTLLLFDGQGQLIETMQGVRQRDALRKRFRTLLDNHQNNPRS